MTTFTFADLDDDIPAVDPFAELLKFRLIDIIRWADKQNPRSQQVAIGPSEIGADCDRRIGYRLAQIPECNDQFDPWPAIVGTAMHSWLDEAVTKYVQAHGDEAGNWQTETELLIDDFMKGHSDLYWRERHTVIDWKGAGPDVMRKVRNEGPPERYRIQAHVYGYGFERLGLPVERVALVFLPRAGWLRDMYVWTEGYEREIAKLAITRSYGIAQNLIELDVLTDGNTHRWEQVNASPSNDCGLCPWYDPGRDLERGADATGCPGRR